MHASLLSKSLVLAAVGVWAGALSSCGAAPQPITTPPPAPAPAELDASLSADAFVLAARALGAPGPTDVCWLVVLGSSVSPPESGTPVVLRARGARTQAYLECGADLFPDVLLGRARFLIATLTDEQGYLVASSFGSFGSSYSPGFVFGGGAVETVLGDDDPDAVTLLELVAPGYETTDNELFSIFAERTPEEGDAPPDLEAAMRALFAHQAIAACADGSGGVLSAELGVRMDGTVAHASFWASSLSGPERDACMVEALGSVVLPAGASPWIFAIALEPDLWLSGPPTAPPTPAPSAPPP